VDGVIDSGSGHAQAERPGDFAGIGGIFSRMRAVVKPEMQIGSGTQTFRGVVQTGPDSYD